MVTSFIIGILAAFIAAIVATAIYAANKSWFEARPLLFFAGISMIASVGGWVGGGQLGNVYFAGVLLLLFGHFVVWPTIKFIHDVFKELDGENVDESN